jgi:hypothetical protein
MRVEIRSFARSGPVWLRLPVAHGTRNNMRSSRIGGRWERDATMPSSAHEVAVGAAPRGCTTIMIGAMRVVFRTEAFCAQPS